MEFLSFGYSLSNENEISVVGFLKSLNSFSIFSPTKSKT